MTASYPSRARAWFTLVILLLAYILSFVDRQILSLMVAPVRSDLGISDFQVSLLQGTAFALFYVFMAIPVGRLADRSSRVGIIAAGVLLWSLMTMCCGLAGSFASLFIARVGVGLGESTLSPAAYSLLSDSFPPATLARASSVYTMGISIGAGLAYLAGAYVVHTLAATDTTAVTDALFAKPWQKAFLAVGLPGLALAGAVLLLREPARQGAGPTQGQVPLITTLRHLFARRRLYGPILAGLSALSILGYGTLNWYPAFLSRTYGMGIREVGVRIGVLYMLSGTGGAFGGAALADFLCRRGSADANLRAVLYISWALLPVACAAPLMPGAGTALLLAAPTIFLLNAFFGVSMAAWQLVTPNRMRATSSALLLFASTACGLVVGSSAVPLLTAALFHDDQLIRYALALLPILVCPIAAWSFEKSLRPYAEALETARLAASQHGA